MWPHRIDRPAHPVPCRLARQLGEDERNVGIGLIPALPFDDDGDAPRATYAVELGMWS